MVDKDMSLGKMILKKKKAVSPVIATILLIALTVTAAAIVWFVVIPLINNTPKQLLITEYDFVTGTEDQYSFTVQNGLGSAITISDITIEFENGTAGPAVLDFNTTTISAGSVKEIVITVSPDFINGETYAFTLHYDEGATVTVTDTK